MKKNIIGREHVAYIVEILSEQVKEEVTGKAIVLYVVNTASRNLSLK